MMIKRPLIPHIIKMIMLMIADLTEGGDRQQLDLSWIVLLLIIDDLTEVMLIIDNQTEDNDDVDN